MSKPLAISPPRPQGSVVPSADGRVPRNCQHLVEERIRFGETARRKLPLPKAPSIKPGTPPQVDFDYHVHLGTNAVLAPGNETYISIFHAAGFFRYRSFVYEFSARPPFHVLGIRFDPLELLLPRPIKGFCFTSTLFKEHDDSYILGYSLGDQAAVLARLTYAQLRGNMVAVV